MDKKLFRKPVILPLLIIIAIILAVIIVKMRPVVKHQDSSLLPRTVEVIKAATIPMRIKSIGYGTVEPAVDIAARAEVSGKISYIHPDLKQGGSLPKDTVVLRIDAVDYKLSLTEREAGLRSSQSALEQLEVEEKSAKRSLALALKNLKVGEAELERKKEIYEKKVISKTTLDIEEQKVLNLRQSVEDLQGKLNAYASRKAATRAQIEQSAAQVEGQQETLGRTEIRLPFDARIGEVAVEKGEFVSIGASLFEALNIDAVEIKAQLPIKLIRPLVVAHPDGGPPAGNMGLVDFKQFLHKLKLEARVRLVGDDFTGAVWDGRVVRFSESVDPIRRTASVVVMVDNPYEKIIPGVRPPLLKGMYVAVDLMAPARPMQVIPRDAIHQGQVYVVDRNNKLELRSIQVAHLQEQLAVIADGLAEDEMVIVTDLIPVIEGMPLKPVHSVAVQETLTRQAAAE